MERKKHYFCGPNWEGNGVTRRDEGERDWESSLKEWKDVANTQGFFWGFASDKVGTDKIKERD